MKRSFPALQGERISPALRSTRRSVQTGRSCVIGLVVSALHPHVRPGWAPQHVPLRPSWAQPRLVIRFSGHQAALGMAHSQGLGTLFSRLVNSASGTQPLSQKPELRSGWTRAGRLPVK